MAGGDRGAGGDLRHPAQFAGVLRDLRAYLLGDPADRGGRLHPGLSRRGHHQLGHGGLWHRLQLSTLRQQHGVLRLSADLRLRRRLRPRRGGRPGLRFRRRRHLGFRGALLGTVLGPAPVLRLELHQHQPGELLRPLGYGHGDPCLWLECLDRHSMARQRRRRLQPAYRRQLPGQSRRGVQSLLRQFCRRPPGLLRQSGHWPRRCRTRWRGGQPVHRRLCCGPSGCRP
ncbi:hypothetical protein D3C81_1458590 [compost metagenome]